MQARLTEPALLPSAPAMREPAPQPLAAAEKKRMPIPMPPLLRWRSSERSWWLQGAGQKRAQQDPAGALDPDRPPTTAAAAPAGVAMPPPLPSPLSSMQARKARQSMRQTALTQGELQNHLPRRQLRALPPLPPPQRLGAVVERRRLHAALHHSYPAASTLAAQTCRLQRALLQRPLRRQRRGQRVLSRARPQSHHRSPSAGTMPTTTALAVAPVLAVQ